VVGWPALSSLAMISDMRYVSPAALTLKLVRRGATEKDVQPPGG